MTISNVSCWVHKCFRIKYYLQPSPGVYRRIEHVSSDFGGFEWGRSAVSRMECVAEADTRGALHCQMVTPRLVLRTEQVPFTQEWTTEKVVGSKWQIRGVEIPYGFDLWNWMGISSCARIWDHASKNVFQSSDACVIFYCLLGVPLSQSSTVVCWGHRNLTPWLHVSFNLHPKP